MEKEGVDTVVMEVSSHALALRKVAPLHFDTAIFTNFTQDHLDFHGSMSAYFEAKTTLFERASYAVLNADDDEVFSLAHRLNIPFVTVSAIGREADICADAVEMRGCAGVAYALTCAQERVPLRCSVPGTFTVSNTLMVVAAARRLGVSFADISAALAHFAGVCGRMERVPAADQLSVSVFIDYAHTPDALEKLLLCAKGFRAEGQSFGSFTHWSFCAGLTFVFPAMAATWAPAAIFAFFGMCLVAHLFWAIFACPETKGMALEEINPLPSHDGNARKYEDPRRD
jgi:UDP-N-acetylmuramyl tripeptide synthase